jgi:hypothetical protein
MHHEDSFEPELSREIAGLSGRAAVPGGEVEQRVVDRLVRSGFLRRQSASRHTGFRWMLGVAAAASLLASFQLGRQLGRSESVRSDVTQTARAGDALKGDDLARVISSSAAEYVKAMSLVQSDDSIARLKALEAFESAAARITEIAPVEGTAIALQLALGDPAPPLPAGTAALASPSRIIWY